MSKKALEQQTEIIYEYRGVLFGNDHNFSIENATREKLIDLIVHCIKWIVRNDMGVYAYLDYGRCGEEQDNIKRVERFFERMDEIQDGEKATIGLWTKW